MDSQSHDKVFVLKKKYIIAAAVAAVLIILCVLFIANGKTSGEISLFYSANRQGAVVIRGEKPMDGVMSGKSMSSAKYSADKTRAAALMSENSAYSLYYTDGKKYTKISEAATNNYVISLDGEKVAYCDSSDMFYIFDSEKGKNTLVDSQVLSFCLSPSGSAAVYTKKTDSVKKLYLYTKSRTTEIGEEYTPLAVSDGIDYIYVLGGDNSLYVLDKNGNMKSKICSAVSADKFCFSADMESVVFSDGTYTYISQSGKSRVRLIPHNAVPIEKNNAGCSCDSGSLTAVFDVLTDMLYSADDENGTKALFYIDKDCARIDIAGNVTKYTVTGSDSLVYLDASGKIYRFEKNESELLISSAEDMIADSKGKYIYYTDSSAKLYAFRKDSPVELASGIKKMYITDDDLLLFVMTDGLLHSAKNGGNIELIDENVYGCVCNATASFYVKNYSSQTGSFELYASDGADDFELIFENISNIV